MTIEEVLALLAENLEQMTGFTADVSADHLHSRPDPDEWSANDVLAHMRACADMWGSAITTILAEDHPTIRAIDPRNWMKQTNYPDLEFETSIRAFGKQRNELLAALRPLPPEGWTRAATVTGAGAPLERTVMDFARRLARHERTHVKQMRRTVAALTAR